jgi:hypothetical protein
LWTTIRVLYWVHFLLTGLFLSEEFAVIRRIAYQQVVDGRFKTLIDGVSQVSQRGAESRPAI